MDDSEPDATPASQSAPPHQPSTTSTASVNNRQHRRRSSFGGASAKEQHMHEALLEMASKRVRRISSGGERPPPPPIRQRPSVASTPPKPATKPRRRSSSFSGVTNEDMYSLLDSRLQQLLTGDQTDLNQLQNQLSDLKSSDTKPQLCKSVQTLSQAQRIEQRTNTRGPTTIGNLYGAKSQEQILVPQDQPQKRKKAFASGIYYPKLGK